MKQALTSPPKKGKVKSAGHDMGGAFGTGNPKVKGEMGMSPQTRKGASSARRMRLTNKFI
jgi:hypothetical protein